MPRADPQPPCAGAETLRAANVIGRRGVLGVLAGLCAGVATGAADAEPCCGPISPKGAALATYLDRSGVERLWLAGFKVAWDTGAPIHRWATPVGHTHCSAFAASMAMGLGIYLLRPPEHSASLLASAQMGWLGTAAASAAGWQPVPDVVAAQARANAGDLTVAAFRNPDPGRPGHIAVVRPSDIDRATLLAQGPFVTQAGGHNWVSVPMRSGFRSHPTAWRPGGTGDAAFFAHAIEAGRLAA